MEDIPVYSVPVRLVVQDASDEPGTVYTYVAQVEAPGPEEARETAEAGVWLEFGTPRRLPRVRRATAHHGGARTP
jgi:hypothetical protein